MLQTGFETAIPARERPQTHALDFTATGIGVLKMFPLLKIEILCYVMSCHVINKFNKEWKSVVGFM
jgi:hypothetical protein